MSSFIGGLGFFVIAIHLVFLTLAVLYIGRTDLPILCRCFKNNNDTTNAAIHEVREHLRNAGQLPPPLPSRKHKPQHSGLDLLFEEAPILILSKNREDDNNRIATTQRKYSNVNEITDEKILVPSRYYI